MSPSHTTAPAGEPETVRFDDHGIEPIPAAARDSTPWQQFWIWAGANIAPMNWVLGALGITLGLSLVETIAVVAVGNLVGCTVFGLFNLMGHRTGVNQMVLSRAAFGRRGAIVPGVVQGLLTMGWVGVNTWVVGGRRAVSVPTGSTWPKSAPWTPAWTSCPRTWERTASTSPRDPARSACHQVVLPSKGISSPQKSGDSSEH
jgi:purine-cytosine permease-like protein